MIGGGIRKTIKKFSTKLEIIRFARSSTTYENGILQPVENEKEFVKIHIQPIGSGDLIDSLPEGQRQKDVKKGWTLGAVRKKDKITIGDGIFTVNAIQFWPLSQHTECDLIRTGEADNVAEQ